MKIRNRKDNVYLADLIEKLRQSRSGFWKTVAKELAKPRRTRTEVNLSKISKLAKDNNICLVPGKVLGAGRLDKKVAIYAFSFSKSAEKYIQESGGTLGRIEDLFKENAKGSNIQIIK